MRKRYPTHGQRQVRAILIVVGLCAVVGMALWCISVFYVQWREIGVLRVSGGGW